MGHFGGVLAVTGLRPRGHVSESQVGGDQGGSF